MKKILFAAITAGVLSLSFAPVQADAQVRVGVGSNGIGIGIGNGHRGWRGHDRGPRCRMVKTWRYHRPVWVKRCW